MDGMPVKQTRKESEWHQRLARFAASGQRVKSFCQAESVSEAGFYRWRKQLAETGGVAPAASFIEVGVMPPAPVVPSMKFVSRPVQRWKFASTWATALCCRS